MNERMNLWIPDSILFFVMAFTSTSEVISISNTINDTVFTKGVINTLFSQTDKYYALKNDGNSLVFDNSISNIKYV